MNQTMEEARKVLEMQEEVLQFSHFTNADAWELGNLIVAALKKREEAAVIGIYLNNHLTVFQVTTDGATLYNQILATQIHHTVMLMEKSSLHSTILMQESEDAIGEQIVNTKDYILCGGGFPIRLEEVGVIGSVVISGNNHMRDHDLLVKCIGKYLHVDEIPRIKALM